MAQSRQLVVAATGDYTLRTEKYLGRDHYVVPVVALVQGVVHAMNASNPELVTASEFSRKPGGWNGRPIFLGHPERNGEPVSGNTPDVLEEECIGIVFNASVRKSKLTMEAWVDVARAEKIAPELITRLKNKQPVEISVGVYVDTDDATGEYEGTKYLGSWRDIVPDHLALLPKGDLGACSIDMGCGVRAAANRASANPKEGTAMSMYAEWLEPGDETSSLLETLRSIPQDELNKLAEDDFAGPNRSFPIAAPEDVAAASSSLGRAKGDRASIKRKVVQIAYRKGDSYVAQLPEDWKRKTDQKNAKKPTRGVIGRILDAFRGAQDATEMSNGDLNRKLYDALRDLEPHLSYVQDYFPVTDPSHVVYCVWIPSTDVGVEYGMGYQTLLYERAFELSDTGVVTINPSRIEVEPVMRYEPVEGTSPTIAEKKDVEPPAPTSAASGESCSCHKKNTPANLQTKGEKDMTKTERVKTLIASNKSGFSDADQAFLEAASDEQLARFEAAAKAEPAKEPVVAPTTAAAAAKQPTFDEILATADPATREAIETGRALGQSKKAATIKTLKDTGRCTFSDEKLGAMSQAELDQLVALAGNVKPATDFSLQGVPRVAETASNEVAVHGDLTAELKAARAEKK